MALALCTLGLAVFTASLASRTRVLAQESAADLRAQWRPFVLPAITSDDWVALGHNPERGLVVARVRNAGRGPAPHVRAQLELLGIPGGISPEHWSLGALAPGDEQDLRFAAVLTPAAQLLIDYRDLADRPYATSITITIVDGKPQYYDVRTWEDHTTTTLGDALYPQPGLRNVSPVRRRTQP
ncbi:hypothetical protein ACIQKB_36805 [Streptomyces sp. NPDC092046]|uniref:hypothetical protein n=1 Tax=Streptomyces sp. NPDC092046 TaxID=3366009 RepID=UPI0037FEDF81